MRSSPCRFALQSRDGASRAFDNWMKNTFLSAKKTGSKVLSRSQGEHFLVWNHASKRHTFLHVHVVLGQVSRLPADGLPRSWTAQCALPSCRDQGTVSPYEIMYFLICNKHWICISTIGCSPVHVRVYDSLFTYPSSSAVRQICNLVRTHKSTLVVEMMDVQIQSGGDDCGLFAIAFAFALCSGRNPCNVTFTQQLMRDHLSSCFHVRKLSPFPSDSKP